MVEIPREMVQAVGQNLQMLKGTYMWIDSGLENNHKKDELGSKTFSNNTAVLLHTYFLSLQAVEKQGVRATPQRLIRSSLSPPSRCWWSGLEKRYSVENHAVTSGVNINISLNVHICAFHV